MYDHFAQCHQNKLNMHSTKPLILISAIAFFSKYNCDSVVFKECSKEGFKCTNTTIKYFGKMEITYQCQEQDITIRLWQFLGSIRIRKLTIENCRNLKLDFTFNVPKSNFEELHVKNIANLYFIPTSLPRNPQSIIFKNVGKIETLPSTTFSQIYNKPPKVEALVFENVIIDTIESKAFDNLTDMKFFRWENVIVNKMKAEALRISCQDNSSIHILNSVVGLLDRLAFRVTAEKMFISNNKFTDIPSNAFNGTLQYFEFSYNSVERIQGGAFDILAKEVNIMRNSFELLQSGAFQKISPELQYDSAQSTFGYRFCENAIKNAEAGGFVPYTRAYKDMGTAVTFANNSFYCICEGLRWMKTEVADFRRDVLNSNHNNVCAFAPCILPLNVIEQLILSKKMCYNGTIINLDEACHFYQEHEEQFLVSLANTPKTLKINFIWLSLQIVVFKYFLYYHLY